MTDVVSREIDAVLLAMQRNARWQAARGPRRSRGLPAAFAALQTRLKAHYYASHTGHPAPLDATEILFPFLQVIGSAETSGPITSAALQAVGRFLGSVVARDTPGAPRAAHAVAAACIHCKFEASDSSSDELVLLNILHVMGAVLRQLGEYLSDELVSDMLETGLSVCCQMRLSEMLRKEAEKIMQDMVTSLFTRLESLPVEDVEAAESAVLRESKTPAAKTKTFGEKASATDEPTQREVPEEETREDTEDASGEASRRSSRHSSRHSSRNSSRDSHVDDTSRLMSRLERPLESSTRLSALAVDTSSTLAETASGDTSSGPQTSVDDTHLASPSASLGVGYGLPAVCELLRVLSALLNPHDQQHTDSMRIMTLGLLSSAVEVGGTTIARFASLRRLVADELCKHLLQLARSDTNVVLVLNALRVLSALFDCMRVHLKFQQELFLSFVLDRLSFATPPADKAAAEAARDASTWHTPTFDRLLLGIDDDRDGDASPARPPAPAALEIRELLLAAVVHLCRAPTALPDLYVNYDCSLDGEDLAERLVRFLARAVFPQSRGSSSYTEASQQAALHLIIDMIGYMEWRSINPANDGTPGNNSPIFNFAELAATKHRKDLLLRAAALFNEKPKKGIAFFEENGLVDTSTPERRVASLAHVLRTTPRLDKRLLGDFISRPDQLDTLHEFMRAMDFAGALICDAMRALLECFRLPGESQQIARITEVFAEVYFATKPAEVRSQDAAYVLAYSVIMLNTDLHNPNVRKRMDLEAYSRNLRGVNDGADFAPEYLAAIYTSIQKREIVLPEEHQNQVGFDYGWKTLLRRAAEPGGVYIETARILTGEASDPTGEASSLTSEASESSGEKLTSEASNAKLSSEATETNEENDIVKAEPTRSARVAPLDVNVSRGTSIDGVAPSEFAPVESTSVALGRALPGPAATPSLDATLFALLWRPFLGALTYSFVHCTDEYTVERLVSAFSACARLAAHFGEADALDFAVLALGRIAGLSTPRGYVPRTVPATDSDGTEVVVSPLAARFGRNVRSQLAAVILFSVAGTPAARSIRDSWRCVFDALQTLFVHVLLPAEFSGSVDFAGIPLRPAAPAAPAADRRSDGGLLSTLSSYLLSAPVTSAPAGAAAAADIDATLAARDCVASCGVERVYAQLLALPTAEALDTPVRVLISMLSERLGDGPADADVEGDGEGDGEVWRATDPRAGTARAYDPSAAFLFELLVSILLRTTVSLSDIWPGVFDFVTRLVADAPAFSALFNERVVAGLMRLLGRVAGYPELRDSVFLALDSVRGLPPPLLRSLAEPLAAGLCELLARHPRVVHTPTEWSLVFSLFTATLPQEGAARISLAWMAQLPPSRDNLGAFMRVLAGYAPSAPPGTGRVALGILRRVQDELPDVPGSWEERWTPLLFAYAQWCLNPSPELRDIAISALQRTLLAPEMLTDADPTVVFDRIFFPLLEELLKPQVFRRDPAGMDKTRLRASALLSKVFLHFLAPLAERDASYEELIQTWIRILSFQDRFMHSGKRDQMMEAIPESLKNVLLVMNASGYLIPPKPKAATPTTPKAEGHDADLGHVEGQEAEQVNADTPPKPTHEQQKLWDLTFDKIDLFLPSLRHELFPGAADHYMAPVPTVIKIEKLSRSVNVVGEDGGRGRERTAPGTPGTPGNAPTSAMMALNVW